MKGLGQVFKAVASAMIGVGKREDLKKDFERTEKQGPWPYIIVGLVMTIVFIGLVVVVVKSVLP
ncbi:MAG: DUF2970 domain-containing protein [Candidatus Thioglobus sp.]|jgi:uncharacterized membrane protein YidH (DUF202 family)|uniref:DUF2970 domain-containing protein n=1 Tax=Candidatus Thioglobus sp. TaxID=2026721 RepID=UPI001D1DFD99|nr:DUF2970 domain-containing protein [Candidatus Thioglobus sp.]MBT3186557.1 DUF2970 domain-containing protein [Candidatus Thioglobus sp.]MBT3432092.1 DUF2970 domain-containing protein [Candidatus Thioglobus sp.]MBT3965581.1 DUF2970 domain-containing protein [Candidatus Thioglobus sp.]MBT4315942.1 DUF2970 domain-containing protein [Candidatus Thioglobus sp.]MBT4553522.1 DUF2970 domain-containing protein [Candidatus Thioglobus sp.]